MAYNTEIFQTVVTQLIAEAASFGEKMSTKNITINDNNEIVITVPGNQIAFLLAKKGAIVPELGQHVAESYAEEFKLFLAYCQTKPAKKPINVTTTGASLTFVRALFEQYLISQYDLVEVSMETED